MIFGAILSINLFLQHSPSWIFFQDLYFRIGNDPSSEIHAKYLEFLKSIVKWSSAPCPGHSMFH